MELSQRRARLVKRLHVNRARQKEALVLVEGVRAAGAACEAEAKLSFAVVSPRLESTPAGRELRRILPDAIEVTDGELDELADTDHPQGVLLVCEEPVHEAGTMLTAGSRTVPSAPLLVLDAIQDPGNVGTLVRSAVAFGWRGVLALDGTVDPWSSKAVRASAGTAFRIPIARSGVAEALEYLHKEDVRLLVASAEGPAVADVGGSAAAGALALVLGNEGAGVRDAVREVSQGTISVPMRGPVESLNAGVAGSILMYELTKERG